MFDTIERLYGTNDAASLTLRQYRRLCREMTPSELLGSHTAHCALWGATDETRYFNRMMAAEREILKRMGEC